MEGDAGAGRLNPTDADDASRTPARTEDSPGSETVAEQTDTEAATGATAVGAEGQPGAVARRSSRLSGRWLAGITAALLVLAGAVGAGGYFALRFHQESRITARNNAAALKAAVECVSATQAPDLAAMAASEQKIIDCGTDAFRSQALLYTSMLVQAYQAANVHVQVSDVRAAVERDNTDGSVDVLVAMRVKVASDQTRNEAGYRLRVRMAPAEGQYKISKLDQVTK